MKWFTKKARSALSVDIHSHLIPGIDDGAPTLEQSLEMILLLRDIGFQKLITTPHVHPKYPNTEERIRNGFDQLQSAVQKQGIQGIEIEAAAEYYVDEKFIKELKSSKRFLSFGSKHILIECSFSVKPFFFESVIYSLKEQGYIPVMAHPERYRFLEGEIDWLSELKATGILFQVTLGSLGGMYGSEPKKLGMELIRSNMVDYLATDLHRTSHLEFVKRGLELREVQKLLESKSLFNEQLL